MKFTCQAFPGEGGSHAVLVVVPSVSWPGVRALMDKSAEKHNNYLTLEVSLPHKPISKGPKKSKPGDRGYQMNHAWGHAGQIAEIVGEDARDVLYEACIASAPRYPTRMSAFGKITAKRWSLATMEEASVVIEKLHQIAAEFGVVLREE